MRGLVLEGGGAKGCYQIGAYKALVEMGIAVDFVMYIDDVSAGGICSRGDFTA